MAKEKVYYTVSFNDRGPVFEWQDWSLIYFAGWWEDKAKYILQALNKLYWEEEAKRIYFGFLEWLEEVKNLDTWKKFRFPTACLVQYKESNNDKDWKWKQRLT